MDKRISSDNSGVIIVFLILAAFEAMLLAVSIVVAVKLNITGANLEQLEQFSKALSVFFVGSSIVSIISIGMLIALLKEDATNTKK